MRNTLIAAAFAAATLSLSACAPEPEVVDTAPDPQAAELAKAPPVELPPAIRASKTYRCKDNSLVYVNFYTDNSAKVASEASAVATGTALSGTAESGPFTADGYSLSGSGDTVTYTSPAGTQSCKA